MSSRNYIVLVLSLLLILPINSQAKNKKSSKADFSLHIFSSTNITGNIEPCGWGGKRSGGLARRATYITENTTQNEHVLILDGGDFIGKRGERARLDAEYMTKAFSLIKYDAINLGEQDFLQRVSFLVDEQHKHKLPFISANIFHPDGETLFFPPYIIKKLNAFKHKGKKIPAIKVGIFGIVFKRLQIVIDKNEPQLVVGDPMEAAKKAVAELKDKCDLIIALAHIRYPQLKTLAETVDGIDVIIGCHDPIYRPNPEIFGDTIVITAGNRGQYVGDLQLEFDKDKKIINHNGRVVSLNKNIKNDPDLAKLVSKFKAAKKNKKWEKMLTEMELKYIAKKIVVISVG